MNFPTLRLIRLVGSVWVFLLFLWLLQASAAVLFWGPFLERLLCFLKLRTTIRCLKRPLFFFPFLSASLSVMPLSCLRLDFPPFRLPVCGFSFLFLAASASFLACCILKWCVGLSTNVGFEKRDFCGFFAVLLLMFL